MKTVKHYMYGCKIHILLVIWPNTSGRMQGVLTYGLAAGFLLCTEKLVGLICTLLSWLSFVFLYLCISLYLSGFFLPINQKILAQADFLRKFNVLRAERGSCGQHKTSNDWNVDVWERCTWGGMCTWLQTLVMPLLVMLIFLPVPVSGAVYKDQSLYLSASEKQQTHRRASSLSPSCSFPAPYVCVYSVTAFFL